MRASVEPHQRTRLFFSRDILHVEMACESCAIKFTLFKRKVSPFIYFACALDEPMKFPCGFLCCACAYIVTLMFFFFFWNNIYRFFLFFFRSLQKQCMDCLRYFCTECVIRRFDRILSCDNCSMLSRRPLIRSQILQMRSKYLRQYLLAKKVSLRGCIGELLKFHY